MSSAAAVAKKPALCRYFMSSGSCSYGDDCQFLHQNPLSFQQPQQNFQTPFANGPSQPNGPGNGQENLGMPGVDSLGNNGDQFFNATFSGGDSNVPEFQPFSRQGPISRQVRNGGMGNGNMNLPNNNSPIMSQQQPPPPSQNGPMGPPPPGPGPLSSSPFSNGGMGGSVVTPNKAPISQSTPLSQHQPGLHPPMQNGPVSNLMNGQMSVAGMPPGGGVKPYLAAGSFDTSMANEFSALNLSVPSTTKGTNPHVSEFIPKLSHSASSPNFSSFSGAPMLEGSKQRAMNPTSSLRVGSGTNPHVSEFIPKLSHSASSPNFSSFSSIPPPGPPGANPAGNASTQFAGISINSTSSPSHSPRSGLSPTNSPLMMRRANTGSPVPPLRTSKPPPGSTIQENVGGTTYFYNAEDFTVQRDGISLPNFTMYHGPPPHMAHMKVKSNMPQFFMPDELKMEILNKSSITMAQIDLGQNIDIPGEVDTYRNLFPLEPPPDNHHQKSKTFGYPTTCYKALNTKDGQTYCLRRIHGFRLVNTKCMTLVDMWKKMYHPNIVQLREVFTTKAFGDHSIVFVYDFYPLSETLLSKHFSTPNMAMNGFSNPFTLDNSARPFSASSKSTSGGPRQHAGLLGESLIWSYVVQLSSALRAIHAAGLSCRTLDPSKIIIYSKSRLRLNCCGIFDVLTFDNNQSNPMALTPHYQQEDLVSLGKVVLALACNSVMAIQRDNLQTSMELVARSYSADLKNLILYLLTNQNRPRSINDIMPMIGARFYTQLDSAQLRSDVIENELCKEVENGRLFRLLCKLGIMNERPEFNLDAQWSETGDRYMLKLFRDYLFHQVDEAGSPWIDMSHIVMCLNKLDAGSPEKITLMSRDEQNVLVVSYAELKQCFENAFTDILNSAHSIGIS